MRLIWLFITLLLGSATVRREANAPSGLMTEFIREPDKVLILDPEPEFSWIVQTRAIKQTAYQILVSSSKELLMNDEGDMWNSNKISGSVSSEIEYSGIRLPEYSNIFWKVRIWDVKGRPSDWSLLQTFKTGRFEGYKTTADIINSIIEKPEKLVKTGNTSYFVDFGRDAFGSLLLEVNPSSVDTIIIHLGEKTVGPCSIDKKPEGTIRYNRIELPVQPGKSVYDIQIPPDTRNTGPSAVRLPDSIGVITPFRYCEIESCRYELKPERVTRKAFWNYFDDNSSSFSSSDTILNQIWELCKYSIKATSFAGLYIDGDRERIPYEADAYINQLGHYYTDREYSMARRTNEYLIKHPTWPTEWNLQTVMLFYNDLLFTGNPESVNRFYKELNAKTLVSLARPDGLISVRNVTDDIMKGLGFSDAKERLKDIVDWPPSQKDTGWKLATAEGERDGYDMVEINTVVNAFHYKALVMMSELAGYIGRSVDSLLYRKMADKVKLSINEKLFDFKKGIYLDGETSGHSSLHSNMMALAFGIVPEEHKKSVIDFIKSRGMACSVYGAQFLLEGLYNEGEADYALSLLTATHERSWWNMIRTGSTIAMEAWDMKFKPNSDWNHAWGAAPANIIGGYMWGIRPARPGYSKSVIRPRLSTLTSSKIIVPTIRGTINAEFRIKGNVKEYKITIPANMECDFIIDSVNNLTMTMNGKKIRSETGVIKLRPGLNKLEIIQIEA